MLTKLGVNFWLLLMTVLFFGCAKTEFVYVNIEAILGEEEEVCFDNDGIGSVSVNTYILDVFVDSTEVGCDMCFSNTDGCLRHRQCLVLDTHQISSASDINDAVHGFEIGPLDPMDRLCIRLMGVDSLGAPLNCQSFDPIDFFEIAHDGFITGGPDGLCAYFPGETMLSFEDDVIELLACSVKQALFSPHCLGVENWMP